MTYNIPYHYNNRKTFFDMVKSINIDKMSITMIYRLDSKPYDIYQVFVGSSNELYDYLIKLFDIHSLIIITTNFHVNMLYDDIDDFIKFIGYYNDIKKFEED